MGDLHMHLMSVIVAASSLYAKYIHCLNTVLFTIIARPMITIAIALRGGRSTVISHKCRLILAPRPLIHFFIKPFLALSRRSLTVPSFIALAVLFPDCQKLGLVVLLTEDQLSSVKTKLCST